VDLHVILLVKRRQSLIASDLLDLSWQHVLYALPQVVGGCSV